MTSKGVRVTGVSFFTHSLELKVGEDYLLLWTISPQDATNVLVSFASDDTSVATVSALGIVTAKKEGTARITVKTDDGGYTDTCVVTVKGPIAVEGVSLSKDAVTIEEGKTQQLYATVNPYDADDTSVTWSSSDEEVALVSSTGLVTAFKPGSATITVTTTDGGYTATCEVTVVEKENYSYSIGDTVFDIVDDSTTYAKRYKIRVFTPVTNDGNVNICLDSCGYDVYSSSGTAIKSLSKYNVQATPSIIKPGETGYFTTVQTYDSEEKENLSVEPHISILNAKKYKATRYDISDIVLGKDSLLGTLTITGKVTNNTTKAASTLDNIEILLFDHDGKFLSSYFDLMPAAIEPGKSCVFEASNVGRGYLKIMPEDVGSYLAYAYPYEIVI